MDISPQDLSELRRIAQKITQENNRKKVDGKFDEPTREFLTLFKDELGRASVYVDFDIASNNIYFSSDRLLVMNEIMNIDEFLHWYKEGLSPVAFAHAVRAGLEEPRYFQFWGLDEDDSDID